MTASLIRETSAKQELPTMLACLPFLALVLTSVAARPQQEDNPFAGLDVSVVQEVAPSSSQAVPQSQPQGLEPTIQEPGSVMNQGQGPMMGQGQGPMLGQGLGALLGQGQGSMMGQGQGPMMGQGQGSMMGQGQSPMMGQGQGPMMGQGQGPMMGQGQSGWTNPLLGILGALSPANFGVNPGSSFQQPSSSPAFQQSMQQPMQPLPQQQLPQAQQQQPQMGWEQGGGYDMDRDREWGHRWSSEHRMHRCMRGCLREMGFRHEWRCQRMCNSMQR